MGDLDGVFVAEKKLVETLVTKEIEVYFGEVLGKHSEIFGCVEENEIELMTEDQIFIDLFEKLNLSTGYNPFNYCVTSNFSETHNLGDDCDVDTACEYFIEKEMK